MVTWDPAQYERFKVFRDRPALDLMVQIPTDLHPKQVWDLGCGSGEHAALLALRHPAAEVHGLDSSEEMLKVARARRAKVDWVHGDIAAFAPQTPPDLIFTNAAIQWLPDHQTLIRYLVSTLTPGGVFACQAPVTFNEPWHLHMRAAAQEEPWAGKMKGVRDVQTVASASQYFEWLSPLADVDIWSTVYLHPLEGEDAIVEWMKGTGLRPYLQRLDQPSEQEAFVQAYRNRVNQDFPIRTDGVVLFPFPRIFIVARAR